MKQKLCFIGNSQLASVRTAWTGLTEAQDQYEATFFGAAHRGLEKLVVNDQSLVPCDAALRASLERTSGGLGEIDTQSYDIFVLVALDWSFISLARLYRDYRTAAQDQHLPFYHLVSDRCFDLAVDGIYDRCLAATVAAQLRSITDKPIILLPEAMRSAKIRNSSEAALWRHIEQHPDGSDLLARLREKTRAIETLHRLQVCPQPEHTLEGCFFTRDIFSAGGTVADPSLPQSRVFAMDEATHMNKDYARIVLLDLLRRGLPEVHGAVLATRG